MGARLLLWWQQIKRHLITILVVAIILVVTIALIIIGYRFDWTGFNGNNKSGKTLWDWLNLLGVLAVPVVVGFGAVWFTTRQGKVADAENKDNQRETALQAYIDKMSELLLEKQLRESTESDEVRKIARVRTLTVLPGLDANRKKSVLQFLYESDLINKVKPLIDLKEASLRGASLLLANLRGANLRGANLREADLREAVLIGADLQNANLWGANLDGANLDGANLEQVLLLRANLKEANLSGANLKQADLREANLSETKLRKTILASANLENANLREADLREAVLLWATLTRAILDGANLKGVIGFTVEELEKQAKSLQGATMPDGSIYP